MCILVDMNTIAALFDKSNSNHKEFEPVMKWILEGIGKMVFGGSKYRKELGKLKKFLPLIAELSKKNKVIQSTKDDILIDKKESAINNDLILRKISASDKRYNDAHLIAIIFVKKVKLISSLDKSSFKFLRESKYYGSTTDRPLIYSGKRNSSLLNNPKYFSNCCK